MVGLQRLKYLRAHPRVGRCRVCSRSRRPLRDLTNVWSSTTWIQLDRPRQQMTCRSKLPLKPLGALTVTALVFVELAATPSCPLVSAAPCGL